MEPRSGGEAPLAMARRNPVPVAKILSSDVFVTRHGAAQRRPSGVAVIRGSLAKTYMCLSLALEPRSGGEAPLAACLRRR
jgi:hypothetical protein